MDRLSELPEPVLQIILCFLSQKGAGQTSVLSKSWRHLWCTRPVLEFIDKSPFPVKIESFLSAMDRNLQGIHDQNLCIEKFTLDISVDHDLTVSFLKKWFPRFKLVKKFHISLRGSNGFFEPFVSDFQSVEEIRLHRCTFDQQSQLCFSRLRRLTLRYVLLSPDLFSSCGARFPCLEELSLDYCLQGIEGLHLVRCCSLKHLVIRNLGERFKATIDAPSIVSFRYEGVFPQSISFAPTTSSSRWKSKICLFGSYGEFATSYFNKLNGLLEALSPSEISLELDEDLIRESTTNTVGVCDATLPVEVEEIVVNKAFIFLRVIEPAPFLNNLFRVFRPRFIHMSMLSNNLQKVAEMLLEKEKDYLWRRDLEGVTCMKDVYCKYYGSFVLQWKGMST